MNDSTIRLAKRVSEMMPCSRAEADKYIAGGWIKVDGVVVEEAGARVADEQDVVIHPEATLVELAPVTILFHKPAGYSAGADTDAEPAVNLLTQENLLVAEHGKQRFLKRHLANLTLTSPLEAKASGLVVFTQDFRVARKLVDEGAKVEQEFVVEVKGTIREGGLALLNHGLTFNGKEIAPMKVSWQNETRLRFALKGVKPGQLMHMCRLVGLSIVSIKRLRIGRVPMASLAPGQWRYLHDYERF
ncbi:rRNA pseudouridine synthase [Massilia antarctica]|uniref:rRNA pseudouridine synthase n=1 Tax=Massilia antarctica TaxID=2765360 RepID=UPI0006BB57F8|nr:rRNA pseudouridine synthase [Massilia sp. H27-R4]MCY0913816.1 rRNA pseudouridine synthase [Massilia sp. H27-R4]CUI04458.1 tRNA pseudouridine synthase A [Janthinobacterium sp. CG23_2]CUU28244.1 tRNA pseudouridine synthase A [Janthinobacterium sp. CG23_2]